jgi:hypothetical protein
LTAQGVAQVDVTFRNALASTAKVAAGAFLRPQPKSGRQSLALFSHFRLVLSPQKQKNGRREQYWAHVPDKMRIPRLRPRSRRSRVSTRSEKGTCRLSAIA